VSQHGSFPGRPRGRRARHDNDAPPWQGYDATPAEEREFPDLPPIRPPEARARDGRPQPDWQPQQPGQPGRPAPGGWPQGGYPAGGGYPATGPGQPGAGPFGTDPFGADRTGTGPFASDRTGTGPFSTGQAGTQQWPPGYPGAFGQPGQGQASQPQPPRAERPEEDIPEWAEPDSVEAFSARWRRRGLDSRDDRRADRRKRRRMLFAGSGAAIVAIGVAVYFLVGSGTSATPGFGNLITSFLPGELQTVPDACSTVPAATLNEYLNGTRKVAEPPLNTGADTECTWTLDNPPTYRVLEVQIEAYSPSALYGNGSATDAAELNYESFEQSYAKPGPKSGEPTAAVSDLSGMPGGTESSSFLATQVFNREGAKTDVANVLVRYRNVIITVVVDGLDQSSGAKKYGPVSMSDLSSVAQTVARQVAGKVVG
jgi:hypothetical protein